MTTGIWTSDPPASPEETEEFFKEIATPEGLAAIENLAELGIDTFTLNDGDRIWTWKSEMSPMAGAPQIRVDVR